MRNAMPFIPQELVTTFEGLKRRTTAPSGKVPETVPWWLYDTQTITDNATTSAVFFSATQANKALSNLGTGGSLPDPQFLTIYGVHADLINATAAAYVTTAAGGVVGAIDDVGIIMMNALPRYVITISGKDYGPFPLSTCHATGGATGFGWGTFTAEESLQFANNGNLGEAAAINGFLTVPPRVDFSLTVTWNAAPNVSGDYRLRMTLVGLLARAVK